MTKYEIIIRWSDVDGVYIAEVPELPGCMADGESYQKALANAETVIAEWIDTARSLGRPVPQPSTIIQPSRPQRPILAVV
jgi:predicted RNase H-like HicB family nuclease